MKEVILDQRACCKICSFRPPQARNERSIFAGFGQGERQLFENLRDPKHLFRRSIPAGQGICGARPAAVDGKALGQPILNVEDIVGLAQDQQAAIGGHGSGGEEGLHLAPQEGLKFEPERVTTCAQATDSWLYPYWT